MKSLKSKNQSEENDEVLDESVDSDLDDVEKLPSTDNVNGNKEVTLDVAFCIQIK